MLRDLKLPLPRERLQELFGQPRHCEDFEDFSSSDQTEVITQLQRIFGIIPVILVVSEKFDPRKSIQIASNYLSIQKKR
jgi:hypothetical protein